MPEKSPATIATSKIKRVVTQRDRVERQKPSAAVALENRDAVVALVGDSQVEVAVAGEVAGHDRHRLGRPVAEHDRRDCRNRP